MVNLSFVQFYIVIWSENYDKKQKNNYVVFGISIERLSIGLLNGNFCLRENKRHGFRLV